jgi:hypothetical protein
MEMLQEKYAIGIQGEEDKEPIHQVRGRAKKGTKSTFFIRSKL